MSKKDPWPVEADLKTETEVRDLILAHYLLDDMSPEVLRYQALLRLLDKARLEAKRH